MDTALTLSQLEAHFLLLEPQIKRLDWIARCHADPSQREEARLEAIVRRKEADDLLRRMELLAH